jgi:hypothetical protein
VDWFAGDDLGAGRSFHSSSVLPAGSAELFHRASGGREGAAIGGRAHTQCHLAGRVGGYWPAVRWKKKSLALPQAAGEGRHDATETGILSELLFDLSNRTYHG